MISDHSFTAIIGIMTISYAMNFFLRLYREKGVEYSATKYVLLSFLYASITITPVLMILWSLGEKHGNGFIISMNPDITTLDTFLGHTFFLSVIAMLYLCLLVSRAYDHMRYQSNNDEE
jgi:hypothetical protein